MNYLWNWPAASRNEDGGHMRPVGGQLFTSVRNYIFNFRKLWIFLIIYQIIKKNKTDLQLVHNKSANVRCVRVEKPGLTLLITALLLLLVKPICRCPLLWESIAELSVETTKTDETNRVISVLVQNVVKDLLWEIRLMHWMPVCQVWGLSSK